MGASTMILLLVGKKDVAGIGGSVLGWCVK